jgi:hypothetical protein
VIPFDVMYPAGLVELYAPRFASACAAVVAPVPPLAIATVPVTFVAVAALPVVL